MNTSAVRSFNDEPDVRVERITPQLANEYLAANTHNRNLRGRIIDAYVKIRGQRNKTYLTAVTIKAWNKYRAGETVTQLKFRTGGANPETFPEPK